MVNMRHSPIYTGGIIMNEQNSILPWDKPQVRVLMNIFDAVVVKTGTTVRKADKDEKIYR